VRAALRTAVATLCAVATALHAAPMPNASRNVSITAREQPVGTFLQNLFGQVDVPAVVSPQLTGNVNGTFNGPAEKVLRDIARVYNLVPYYDGSAMHVVSANDLVSKTFPVARGAADRLLREVADLGLADARNTLRETTGGGVIAVGTKRFVDQVEEILRAAEAQKAAASAPPAPGQLDFRVFYLRYAWAQDTTTMLGGRQVVVPGVASILRSLVGSRSPGANAQDIALRPSQPKLKGQGLASQGVPVNHREKTGASNSAVETLVNALGTAAVQQVQAQQQQEAALTQPPVYDPRQVTIEAEPRLNAVIVRDVAERLQRYEQLIAALDVEPQSLEIEATIIDVNTDRMRELGVDWRFSNAGNSAGFAGAVSPLGAGGVASVVLGSVGQFVARIRALQAEGAARVVSSPQVVTLSNVEALFDNTSTFYVRVAGHTDVDLFNVSAGTSLRVTPHVFRDRDSTRIKLLVNVEDGALTPRQVDQIPVVERSTINTQALIAEGESLLIGGMVRDQVATSVDKVPGLGDVPVIGGLFKNTTKSASRVERMFLITPRLAGSRPASTTAQAPAPAKAPAPAPQAPAQPTTVVSAGTPSTQPASSQTRPEVVALTPAQAPAPRRAPPQEPSVELDLDAIKPTNNRR
jgi:type III secretion protein C